MFKGVLSPAVVFIALKSLLGKSLSDLKEPALLLSLV